MTDLETILPDFPSRKYPRLLSSFEKHSVTTADLLSLDTLEIAKRTSLPVLEVKNFCVAVLEALQASLDIFENGPPFKQDKPDSDGKEENDIKWRRKQKRQKKMTGEQLVNDWKTISLLDPGLDHALRGGIPTGSVTEFTGESGAGKTQFLLTLLLSAQLPPPIGLSCSSLYISTESGLPVTRLRQLLLSHPTLIAAEPKPSLDRIVNIVTPDLEAQDHIIYFQVPVAIQRFGIGLLIIDSVASNYRVEFDAGVQGGGKGGGQLAQRSSDLIKLGQFLRNLAVEMDLAIVVANQVADRIPNNVYYDDCDDDDNGDVVNIDEITINNDDTKRNDSLNDHSIHYEKKTKGKTLPNPTIRGVKKASSDLSTLDHQQRWLTGWGDEFRAREWEEVNLKTPSLGLIWTNQIACRIALIKRPIEAWSKAKAIASEITEETHREEMQLKWRRWMKLVFASHAPESGSGVIDAVEFFIGSEGIKSIERGDTCGS